MSNQTPTDAEIALAIDQFLGSIPQEVPTCISVVEDMLDVHHGLSLDHGKEMVVLQITSPDPNEDGTYSKIVLGLDEDAAVKLLFAVHSIGTEIWGDEEEDCDDDYLG